MSKIKLTSATVGAALAVVAVVLSVLANVNVSSLAARPVTVVGGDLGSQALNLLRADSIVATNYLTATTGSFTDLSATTETSTNLTATSITGTLQTAAQPNVTGLGTITNFTATNGTVTTATVSNRLTLGSASFTGAVKYGTAATYDSGAAITHGFTTTPTVCLLLPVRDVTSTLTLGATTFSSDMATVAEPIYWMCGQ